MILLPVALVFHFTVPPQPVAVNVAVSVPQRFVFVAAITGADGVPPELIVNIFEVLLVPQILVHVAE